MKEKTNELIFFTADVRDLHVVGGGGQIFIFLASEDVEAHKMDLGVAVLSSLRGGHFNNLAWTTLDDNVPILSQRRALHRIGGGGASIGALKRLLMLED
jgi:hypothetical protein